MRIDIDRSIRRQEEWLHDVRKRALRRGRLGNCARLLAFRVLKKAGWWEPLVDAGLIRSWFKEFEEYWRVSLRGRPLTVVDFHHLRFLFRCRFQETKELSWNGPVQHLANWQHPKNLFGTFSFIYREALNPVRDPLLLSSLSRGMRVLEYGCGIAPMYRTWRAFLSHVDATWVLADIPGFPFHYARHAYARDEAVSFCVIYEDRFHDPLRDCPGTFDFMIAQEVFEHLDEPRGIAEYLLDRLNPGGWFYFDYSASEEKGLDTPAGQRQRRGTLEYLASRLDFAPGTFRVSDESLGRCVGRKRR